MRIRNALISIVFIYTTISFGGPLPKDFPKDLIYHHAPISPNCLYLDGNAKKVALDKCSLKSDPDIKIVGSDKDLIKQGYIGFDYSIVDNTGNSLPSYGYQYYKVIGKVKNNYTVYTLNNGGGSGQFTSIYSVSRHQDSLNIKTILPGGDRCNGGIAKVKQVNSLLTYSIYITPADFLNITNQNPHNLRAYDDLDACAICCTAVATYETDLTSMKLNEKLVSVELGVDSYNPKPSPASKFQDANDKQSYQACFDKLIKSYTDVGNSKLTAEEFKQFMTLFNTKCAHETPLK